MASSALTHLSCCEILCVSSGAVVLMQALHHSLSIRHVPEMATSACCAHLGGLVAGQGDKDTEDAKGLNAPIFLVLLVRPALRNHRPLTQRKVWNRKMCISRGGRGWGIKVNTLLTQ